MKKRYPILQSGFIDLTEEGLSTPQPRHLTVYEQTLAKEHLHHVNPYFYSEKINRLFVSCNSDPEWIRNFDNRELLLKAALESFKVKNIAEWINLQKESTYLGQLHVNFLMETLVYVYFNTPRRIGYYQWYRLLEADQKSKDAAVFSVDYFKELQKYGSGWKLDLSVETFIYNWIRQNDGYADLLFSLQAIFGPRTVITDVA